LGITDHRKTTLTRELGSRDFEDNEVKEASEASEECGGEIPTAQVTPSAVVYNEDGEKTKTVFKDHCEEQPVILGAEDLFRAGRYVEVAPTDFMALAWQASAGMSWQEHGCSETWDFCRYLLAHPEFENLRRARLVERLRGVIDDEDAIDMIVSEIERVNYAKGMGPLDWATAMASQYPIEDPAGLKLERYNRFLSISFWLQMSQGDKPIVLPVEKIAALLGVTPSQVSNWRQRAQGQQLLHQTAPYIAHKRGTQFRFATERFPIFRERHNLRTTGYNLRARRGNAA
jgi:hypothetical protein